jgi:predicted nucleic acid-binding protein
LQSGLQKEQDDHQAADWLELVPTVAASAGAIRAALADAAAGRASYWDALFVTTAGQAGCTIVLTEDMSDGGILGGLEIHNPFAAAGGLADLACRLLGLS